MLPPDIPNSVGTMFDNWMQQVRVLDGGPETIETLSAAFTAGVGSTLALVARLGLSDITLEDARPLIAKLLAESAAAVNLSELMEVHVHGTDDTGTAALDPQDGAVATAGAGDGDEEPATPGDGPAEGDPAGPEAL